MARFAMLILTAEFSFHIEKRPLSLLGCIGSACGTALLCDGTTTVLLIVKAISTVVAVLISSEAPTRIRTVRRQGFLTRRRPKQREIQAHLVDVIMRRVLYDASIALRVSFV